MESHSFFWPPDGFDPKSLVPAHRASLDVRETDEVLAVIEDPGTNRPVALVRREKCAGYRIVRTGFRGRCGGFYGRDMLQFYVHDAQSCHDIEDAEYPDWQGIMEQLLAGPEGTELGIVPKPRKPAKRKQKLDTSPAATRKRVGAVSFGR